MYSIEVGKGKSKYVVKATTENKAQAWAIYKGYHVHSGGKKRLMWRKGNLIRTLDRRISGLMD